MPSHSTSLDVGLLWWARTSPCPSVSRAELWHWRNWPCLTALPPLLLKANATGGGGHVQMVQKAMQDLTYTSLCFPEAIKARGMDNAEDVPYYFYRDDGLLVWEAIKT